MSEDTVPAPMDVRPARASDAAQIARLSVQLGYPADADTMRRRLVGLAARSDHAVLVAQRVAGGAGPADEAALLGWLHVGRTIQLESGERAEILGLVVDAAARRAGVGRRLVAAAEQWARAAGLDRIVVRSNAVRPEAHSFYPKLDYVLAKTQRVYARALRD